MTSIEKSDSGDPSELLCAICQEPAQAEENRVRLHCTRSDSEMYHANCLSKYLKVNNCKFRYGGAADRKVGYACPAHPKCRVRNTNAIPANRARRRSLNKQPSEPAVTSDDNGVRDPPQLPAEDAPVPPRALDAPTDAPQSNAKTADGDIGSAPTKTVRVLNAGRLPPLQSALGPNSHSLSGSGTSEQGSNDSCTAASAPDLASMVAKPEAEDETTTEDGDNVASFKTSRSLGSSKGIGLRSSFPEQPPSAWTSPNHTKSKIISVARAPNPWTRPFDKKKKSLCHIKGSKPGSRAIRNGSSASHHRTAKVLPGDRKERKHQVLDLLVPEPLTPRVNGNGTSSCAAAHLMNPSPQTTTSAPSADVTLSGNSMHCAATEEEDGVVVVPVAWIQPVLDRSSAWAAGPPPSATHPQQHMMTTDNTSSPFLPRTAAAEADAAANTFSPFSASSHSSAAKEQCAHDDGCDDRADEELCSILLNTLISGM